MENLLQVSALTFSFSLSSSSCPSLPRTSLENWATLLADCKSPMPRNSLRLCVRERERERERGKVVEKTEGDQRDGRLFALSRRRSFCFSESAEREVERERERNSVLLAESTSKRTVQTFESRSNSLSLSLAPRRWE